MGAELKEGITDKSLRYLAEAGCGGQLTTLRLACELKFSLLYSVVVGCARIMAVSHFGVDPLNNSLPLRMQL